MNKTVLISGGLGDIGRALALQFCQNGMNVAISDLLSESEATSQIEDLKAKGCKNVLYKQVDVTNATEVETWINAVEEKWGTAQIIIPNAGIVMAGLLTENTPLEEVRKQLDVNFWGSYHLAVQSAKRIKEKKLPGRVVFIGSWAAERPTARISSYCISKAAVRMLMKTLALELAEHQIMVNEVALGIVEAGLSKKNQQKNPELLKVHLSSTPVHQLISVEEVAKHVWTLSDFEKFNITGTTILIDGGLSLTSKMTP